MPPFTATSLCGVALPQKCWARVETPVRLTHEQSSGELSCQHGDTYEQGHEHLLPVTAALAKPAGADFSVGSSAVASLDAWGRAANFTSRTEKSLLLPFAQIPLGNAGPVSGPFALSTLSGVHWCLGQS